MNNCVTVGPERLCEEYETYEEYHIPILHLWIIANANSCRGRGGQVLQSLKKHLVSIPISKIREYTYSEFVQEALVMEEHVSNTYQECNKLLSCHIKNCKALEFDDSKKDLHEIDQSPVLTEMSCTIITTEKHGDAIHIAEIISSIITKAKVSNKTDIFLDNNNIFNHLEACSSPYHKSCKLEQHLLPENDRNNLFINCTLPLHIISPIGGDGTLNEVVNGLCRGVIKSLSCIYYIEAKNINNSEEKKVASQKGNHIRHKEISSTNQCVNDKEEFYRLQEREECTVEDDIFKEHCLCYARHYNLYYNTLEFSLLRYFLPPLLYIPAGTGADYAKMELCCKSVNEVVQILRGVEEYIITLINTERAKECCVLPQKRFAINKPSITNNVQEFYELQNEFYAYEVDIGKISLLSSGITRYFVNECSLGMSVSVVSRVEKLKRACFISWFGGLIVFAIAALISLIKMQPKNIRIARLPPLPLSPFAAHPYFYECCEQKKICEEGNDASNKKKDDIDNKVNEDSESVNHQHQIMQAPSPQLFQHGVKNPRKTFIAESSTSLASQTDIVESVKALENFQVLSPKGERFAHFTELNKLPTHLINSHISFAKIKMDKVWVEHELIKKIELYHSECRSNTNLSEEIRKESVNKFNGSLTQNGFANGKCAKKSIVSNHHSNNCNSHFGNTNNSSSSSSNSSNTNIIMVNNSSNCSKTNNENSNNNQEINVSKFLSSPHAIREALDMECVSAVEANESEFCVRSCSDYCTHEKPNHNSANLNDKNCELFCENCICKEEKVIYCNENDVTTSTKNEIKVKEKDNKYNGFEYEDISNSEKGKANRTMKFRELDEPLEWYELPSSTLCFANGRWYGGGLQVTPHGNPADGLLSCTNWVTTFWPFVLRLFSLYNGKHIYWNQTSTFDGARFIVDMVPEECKTCTNDKFIWNKEKQRGSGSNGDIVNNKRTSDEKCNDSNIIEKKLSTSKGITTHDNISIKPNYNMHGKKHNVRNRSCGIPMSMEADGELIGELPALVEIATVITFLAPRKVETFGKPIKGTFRANVINGKNVCECDEVNMYSNRKDKSESSLREMSYTNLRVNTQEKNYIRTQRCAERTKESEHNNLHRTSYHNDRHLQQCDMNCEHKTQYPQNEKRCPRKELRNLHAYEMKPIRESEKNMLQRWYGKLTESAHKMRKCFSSTSQTQLHELSSSDRLTKTKCNHASKSENLLKSHDACQKQHTFTSIVDKVLVTLHIRKRNRHVFEFNTNLVNNFDNSHRITHENFRLDNTHIVEKHFSVL